MSSNIKVMVTLIEAEYARNERNTPAKMKSLIKNIFDEDVSEKDIENIVGIQYSDEEKSERRIQYG